MRSVGGLTPRAPTLRFTVLTVLGLVSCFFDSKDFSWMNFMYDFFFFLKKALLCDYKAFQVPHAARRTREWTGGPNYSDFPYETSVKPHWIVHWVGSLGLQKVHQKKKRKWTLTYMYQYSSIVHSSQSESVFIINLHNLQSGWNRDRSQILLFKI